MNFIHNNNGDMMRNLRSVDYYYKSCDICNMDDKDKKRYEYMNDYGYNIDNNRRRVVDLEKECYRVKRFVKSTYNNGKR